MTATELELLEFQIEEKRGWLLEALGWCACGNPDDAFELLFDVLSLIAKRDTIASTDIDPLPDGTVEIIRQRRYDAITQQLEAKFFAYIHKGAYMSYLYWLDDKGLTDHGVSVNTCSLTGWGRDMLQRVEEYIKLLDAEPDDEADNRQEAKQ